MNLKRIGGTTRRRKLSALCLIVIFWAFLPRVASAALTIEITGGMEGAMPIAIVPFQWQGGTADAPLDVAQVVQSDLERSGRFRPLPRGDMLAHPHQAEQVNFKDWRALGVESLVIGQVRALGPGSYAVQFRLFDVFRGEQLIGYSIPASGKELRRVAHQVSDRIYQQLTGQRGAFDTRVAYVVSSGTGKERSYELQIADADGFNPQTVVTSREPLMSPDWSPDNSRIAYVSFESGRPAIYVQEIATGDREKVASFAGINGAPAFSPDGRRLALTLSRDGNPDIHVLDLASKRITRITRHYAIETEPAWSPDGKSLVFTSDRGGKPQLYEVPAGGGSAKRLTFEGDYNARGVFSPDGRQLAMVHGRNGRFQVAILERDSGALRILTDGQLDESPSFAPNGSMIIYATRQKGRGVLAAVSADGAVRQRLVLQEGDVREPAWGFYMEE